VPVPDGASADCASVLAARESEHRPPRPTSRKRLPGVSGAVGACADAQEAAMHLHTYRDEDHSRHFDLVGHHGSIDLVTITAASLLMVGFACAVVALLVD